MIASGVRVTSDLTMHLQSQHVSSGWRSVVNVTDVNLGIRTDCGADLMLRRPWPRTAGTEYGAILHWIHNTIVTVTLWSMGYIVVRAYISHTETPDGLTTSDPSLVKYGSNPNSSNVFLTFELELLPVLGRFDETERNQVVFLGVQSWWQNDYLREMVLDCENSFFWYENCNLWCSQ